MTWIDWYNSLAKPSWTPEPRTIGLIWQILYPIIAISFGYVFIRVIGKKYPARVAWPFGLNLISNVIFTPIQFGLRNLTLASVDIVIVWATILWSMAAIWKYSRIVAGAQVPYLIWVSIAMVLQLSITVMNW